METLYPPATSAEIDDLLDLAVQIQRHAAAWVEPTCQSASPADREAAAAALAPLLHSLDTRIEGADHVVGSSITLADIALASSLLSLYQDVLGLDVQATTPHIVRWLQGLLAHENFHAVLGKHCCIYNLRVFLEYYILFRNNRTVNSLCYLVFMVVGWRNPVQKNLLAIFN